MSEHSKHTRGPWVAVEIGQGGPADAPMPIYEIRSADNRAVIAEFVDGNNSALLAAAPDLLAALTLALRDFDGMNESEISRKYGMGEMMRVRQARAAIAKATQ